MDEKKRRAAQKRWQGVEKSEKKAIASKAAHARWRKEGVLVAQRRGVITLGGYELACAVLEDERRVISERAFSEALGHKRHADDYAQKRQAKESGALVLPGYVIDDRIGQFLSEEARAKLAQPVRYQVTEGFGIPAVGIEAVLIADVCDAYIAAREAGVLRPEEQHKATAAMTMMRALAKVAIVALIDEATGYQVLRSKDELQKLLEQYVSEEHRPWTKVFPDEYYIELFRLRKLKIEDVRKRPSYFGHLTNDIVYSRLVPGMLPRLKEVNPANGKGRRKRTHTQHLTNSLGEQHLRTHLAGVIMLMKASDSYTEFVRALDKAAPKQVVLTGGEDVEEES